MIRITEADKLKLTLGAEITGLKRQLDARHDAWLRESLTREKAESERDTARARVKDLEAELEIAWEDDPALKELQAKVARAVALLEACEGYRPPPAVERALEALR